MTFRMGENEKDVKIRKRFEEKVNKLVDVGMQRKAMCQNCIEENKWRCKTIMNKATITVKKAMRDKTEEVLIDL